MSKFNTIAPRPHPDAVTGEGGDGFTRDERDELLLLAVANTVGEDTFYETGAQRDTRFVDLVAKVTANDHGWMRSFIPWLRTGANMRSASVVAAAEYVAAGGAEGRAVVASALQRPDEPGEMLAYWRGIHGPKMPMAVKRGVADAAVRMYSERSILRYDGGGKPWRFGDVIELTHPKPKAQWQADLFRVAIERRHNRDNPLPESLAVLRADEALITLPDGERRGNLARAIDAGWSWERLAGWLPGGMDREAWEAVIPNMGLMALVRNLRNFDEANVSEPVAAQVCARMMDPDEVRRSRQFPLRFLSAWKNTTSMRWGHALETALDHSLANLPALTGRTLILVDVSPSMVDAALSGHRGTGTSPLRWEVASVFGTALARRADHADVVLFDMNPVGKMAMGKSESVLRMIAEIEPFVRAGNGTDTLGSLAATYDGHDRVVILTDEQTGINAGRTGWGHNFGTWDAVAHIKVPVFTFNLAGYQIGHSPVGANWRTFGGLNDASFGLIDLFERRRRQLWPWEA